MANSAKTLIDIPDDKGVHVKSAGAKGEKYVYRYTRYFRNADGNPRNKSVSIGKLDLASGKMVPNANYYEMFHISPDAPGINLWSYGYAYLAFKCCRDMGLWECLSGTFGACAAEIVSTAAYIIREGNAMDGIDDWQERSLIPGFRKVLTSQTCSKLFESLPPQDTHDFFERWVATAICPMAASATT
jgi:hypothetical protein